MSGSFFHSPKRKLFRLSKHQQHRLTGRYGWALLFCIGFLQAAANDFTIVLDAGHGGKDPGAQNATKRKDEKAVTLQVALQIGKLIEKNYPEVKVVYTRKTDVFIPLQERARIANRAKADLFISIHTNAAKNRSAKGAETYTLGVEEERTEKNLEIAKRENSVILLEDNYEKQYANFNPNSAESYIIFEYMQSEYVKESIQMAQYVQNQLVRRAKRADRGVRQAGLWVLHATSMPSILVELGYISNAEEEKYLTSATGQETFSQCVFRAFETYYSDYKKQKKSALENGAIPTAEEATKVLQESAEPPTPTTPEAKTVPTEAPLFKVQFLSSSTPLKKGNSRFKGLQPVDCYQENGLYKYTYGATTDYTSILALKKKVNAKFADAFIVAFKDGKRMDTRVAIQEYRNQNKKK